MLVNYACHCTTLGGEFNKICAEWAGYACDEIERQNPGAIALVIIGCGADANPEPRRNLDDAKNHAAAVAREANAPARTSLTPLPGRRRSTAFKPDRAAPRPAAEPRGRWRNASKLAGLRGDASPAPCSSGSTAARPCPRRSPTPCRPGASATTWPWSSWAARSSSTTPSGSSGRPTPRGSGSPPTATTSPATSPRSACSTRGGTRPTCRWSSTAGPPGSPPRPRT